MPPNCAMIGGVASLASGTDAVMWHDMHDELALQLQADLAAAIERSAARGVLIDISTLDMIDSFIGRVLADISAISRLQNAATVVVGMRPAVAITLVELGLSLPGILTATNAERGMRLLGNTGWTGRSDDAGR